MNNLQQRLIDVLKQHDIPAQWAGDTTMIDATGAHPESWEYVELGNTEEDVNDYALLLFDEPESLTGCSLQTQTGLQFNREKYLQAWEIAIGLYYASIGGATMYGEETNAQFNEWAKQYGGLANA